MKKYADKLKDPRWQKKRLEILERDNWCCQKCYDPDSPLAVHHFRYIPGMEPWDYPDHLLITLCENCHSEEYEAMPDEISSLIKQIKDKGFYSDQIREIAQGFNALTCYHIPWTASVIKYFLSNDAIFEHVKEVYFKELDELTEGNKCQDNENK